MAKGAHLLEFEVVLDVAGQAPTRSARRVLRSAVASAIRLATAIASAAALATSCAPAPAPPANAGAVRIEINTPQGVRAQQVMDMLNSDWPIGPVSVKTLAAPDMVDAVAPHGLAVVGPALHARPAWTSERAWPPCTC